MGYKRPFDDEEFQELTYKQQKHLDYSDKLTSFADEVRWYDDASEKHDISDEGGTRKSQHAEDTEVSIIADKDVESSTPLSWVTSSISEEDGVCGKEAYSSLFSEYFELNLPRRAFVELEDVYSSFLDRSPRKQVPIGPNHQANVPAWGLQKKNNQSGTVEAFNPIEASPQLKGSDHIFYMEEERLLGICIIPMPDSTLSAQDRDKAGDGKKDCNCLDGGSVRCVRLHIVEARENLRKTFGLEKFVDLGLGDMGEEVARKCSEEEEQIFHEVVFSNPASLGSNFWKHLAVELPSWTTRELVSYYFNVFMLRRRAAQNRLNFLDIDSDDDEWHGRNGDSLNVAVTEEDEDSAMESLLDEDDQLDDEDDSSSDDDSDDDGNGDLGDGFGNTTEADVRRIHMLESSPTDKILGSLREDLDAQDDSCMSFECQPNMTDSCSPVETGAIMEEDGVRNNHSECWHGDSDGSNNGAGPGYLLDDSDAKYSAGLDLLPTFNMIEEFFGPGSWKNNTNDDKVID